MGVEIDEPWGHDGPAGIEHERADGDVDVGAHRDDPATRDDDVGPAPTACVDDVAAAENESHGHHYGASSAPTRFARTIGSRSTRRRTAAAPRRALSAPTRFARTIGSRST